jgi:hypothetical protein
MPLGDSITEGLGMSGGGGYRVELFRLAVESGMDFKFVGSYQNGPTNVSGLLFPRSHEGHTGATIEEIDSLVQRNLLLADPHIILLHIGTYDMLQNPSGAAERLGTLMDNIIARAPKALLVVSNIIPFPSAGSPVIQYNAAIPFVVDERRMKGKNVLFVDQNTGFSAMQPDGVHPTSQGYTRMGQVWFNAIYEYLVDVD